MAKSLLRSCKIYTGVLVVFVVCVVDVYKLSGFFQLGYSTRKTNKLIFWLTPSDDLPGSRVSGARLPLPMFFKKFLKDCGMLEQSSASIPNRGHVLGVESFAKFEV